MGDVALLFLFNKFACGNRKSLLQQPESEMCFVFSGYHSAPIGRPAAPFQG